MYFTTIFTKSKKYLKISVLHVYAQTHIYKIKCCIFGIFVLYFTRYRLVIQYYFIERKSVIHTYNVRRKIVIHKTAKNTAFFFCITQSGVNRYIKEFRFDVTGYGCYYWFCCSFIGVLLKIGEKTK